MTRRSRPPRRPRPSLGADLHVHTTHSDGSCSPGEVVRAAASVGLSAVAITDHDTLSALAVARPEAARLGIELIDGIEASAGDDGREVHVLGLFVDPDDAGLIAATDAARNARRDRVERMVALLADHGLTVDLDGLRRTFPGRPSAAGTWPKPW